MAWTDPITWVFKTTILSASLLNQQIRDNMNYLKTRPKHIIGLGSTDQTGITTAWVKVTGSDLAIAVDGTATLMFDIRMRCRSTTASARAFVDIWDVDNSVYLSSGTFTPLTSGLYTKALETANIGDTVAFSHLVENISAGTHNYEVHIISSHAAMTLDNVNSNNQVSVREV